MAPSSWNRHVANFVPNMATPDNEEFQDDLNNIVLCPECKEYPPNLVEEFSSGDLVCGSCGVVIGGRIIDTRSEWRTFSNDDQGSDDPSRVGDNVNPLLNGSQLETSIANSDSRSHRALSRLQNSSSQQDKATKHLLQAYKQIGTLCDAINIGKSVSDSAKHFFKLTEDHKFLKGKSQEAVIAGCIFIACRHHSVPRTFREIFNLTSVSKKEIGRVFKALESFLLKLKDANVHSGTIHSVEGYETSGSTTADSLCARYCSLLTFRNSQKIENISRSLAQKTSSVAELAGRSPLSVAAACIYMASHLMGEPRTSREIASVAGVSDGTIKTAYRFLYTARDQLIEPSWTADGKGNLKNLPQN